MGQELRKEKRDRWFIRKEGRGKGRGRTDLGWGVRIKVEDKKNFKCLGSFSDVCFRLILIFIRLCWVRFHQRIGMIAHASQRSLPNSLSGPITKTDSRPRIQPPNRIMYLLATVSASFCWGKRRREEKGGWVNWFGISLRADSEGINWQRGEKKQLNKNNWSSVRKKQLRARFWIYSE